VLEVHDLHVRYGAMEALRGVSFEVRHGEAVAIIGANGSGKSTTLRALMGLVPAAGRVSLDGRPLAALTPWARAEAGMAWVPEGRRVFGDFTVEENLLAGGYRHRRRADVGRRGLARVYALFPSLADRRRQLGRTLSGGEQQMLALGRALMAGPRLLLVDEASLGLAPLMVERVYTTIATLVASGVTLLLVEQNVRRALSIATRAYVLEVGRIVRTGTAADLADDPAVRDAYLGA
jgi:branched-chain amino acid transport system ATP-binding protein